MARIDEIRDQQIDILEKLLARLRKGAEPLRTDLFQEIVQELELRVDYAAVCQAWEEEDPDAAPSRMFVQGPDANTVVSTGLQPSAKADLAKLAAADQRAVMKAVEMLVSDPAPRGLHPLGDARGHMRVRVGHLRVLYCVRDGIVLLVRITSGV